MFVAVRPGVSVGTSYQDKLFRKFDIFNDSGAHRSCIKFYMGDEWVIW